METEQWNVDDGGGQKMLEKRGFEKVKTRGCGVESWQPLLKWKETGRKSREPMEGWRQTWNFTSNHTLLCVGNVIQGNVCPHVSAHFCQEGHSERCRVGQDCVNVRPVVAMVSCSCPHQQTGAAWPNSVDLVRCNAKTANYAFTYNSPKQYDQILFMTGSILWSLILKLFIYF